MVIRPEDLSDEHINQRCRFAGLPPLDATELARLRGYLRWMRSRFAPDPGPQPCPWCPERFPISGHRCSGRADKLRVVRLRLGRRRRRPRPSDSKYCTPRGRGSSRPW